MASFRTLQLLLLILLTFYLQYVQSQGLFPPLVSLALNKPVSASSTCGVNMAEQYCEYTTDVTQSLAPNCISATCNDTCTYSSVSPLPILLTQYGTRGNGISVLASTPSDPGSSSDVFQFDDSFISIPSANVSQFSSNGFTFAAWIKQDSGNTGTLISKSISDGTDRTYALSITENSVTFNYHPSNLVSGYSTLTISNSIDLTSAHWHHITVTVYSNDFALYINGTVVNATGLVNSIVDTTNTIYLGQIAPGIGHYNGLMKDVFYYPQALTEREVEEVVTGVFPFLHLSSNCRCPPSHPVISSINIDRCIQHTGVSTGRGSVVRINSNSHTAGYANDNVYSTSWVSAINQREANFTVSLVVGSQSAIEIVFVFINYGAPPPKAAILQKSSDGGQTFQPLQYFADDCQSYFGLGNNEPLTSSTDVNCITEYSIQTPLTGQTARVRLLDSNIRPGDINTDTELRSFLSSDTLQISLIDYFTDNTTMSHLYYDITEIIIAGRCSCNGHAPRCSSDLLSICECTHFTQGDRCNECLPLYNDKPWRGGTLSEAFPCKLCNCNNHAISCYYNASLDSVPNDHDQGGGGVCLNCQDNTDGINCDSCTDGYYRPAGVSQTDSNPCSSCDCNSVGSTGGICVKSEGIPGQVVGQCPCKTNVIGRSCSECSDGFYNLTATNPNGCQPCNCNTDGTVGGSQTCNTETGQCSCKLNVEGLKCDQCINGTRGLSGSDPNGCSICNCNLMGAVSADCQQSDGQCTCKSGVTGLNCDMCQDGFYDFSSSGCQSCLCSVTGSTNSSCRTDGSCYCLPGFTGNKCDQCAIGYYNYTAGCLSCDCNTAGTTTGLLQQCNTSTGQCNCKTNVQGRSCDTCIPGFTNLQSSNTLGCSPCDCILNNAESAICHPMSSQCTCLSHASGLRCDVCQDGYYAGNDGTCLSCQCNILGSFNSSCSPNNGQCYCNMTTGRTCDSCAVGQYGFPNCRVCQCNSSGSIDTVCNDTTGVCMCKQYVTGMNCDTCISGFQLLQASNPFGCTKAPEQQAPPSLSSRTAVSIEITWSLPSSPNGVIELYRIYRNGTLITSVPRSTTSFNDTNLMPYTQYVYEVESVNIIGSARSIELGVMTLEAPPQEVNPPTLTVINATFIQAQWQAPNISNGIITEYRLNLIAIDDTLLENPLNTFIGLTFQATIGNLQPFSLNGFELQACTSAGCSTSSSVNIRTAEEVPALQIPPNVMAVNSTSLYITWSPPAQPNGIITLYEVYQRSAPFTGDGNVVGSFLSNVLSMTVHDLQPFTLYEFSVIAYTSVGGRRSEWSSGMTDEQEPQGIIDPILTTLSSTSISITWSSPTTPNGNITSYQLYQQYSSGTTVSLTNSTSPGSYTVMGLSPYTEYQFYVLVCNGAGCTASSTVVQRTLESVPQGFNSLVINSTTDSSVYLSWSPPTSPNGIITSYNITRRRPSLLSSPLNRDLGVSFYGTGHVTFPSITEFSGSTTTFSIMFKTSSPNGLLVYFVDSSNTDLFAIELRSGLPWFIFDAGTGPAAFTLSNTSIALHDSAWHSIVVSKDGTNGMMTVDDVYTGTGTSIGGNRFLGEPTAVYFGGLPSNGSRMSQSGHLNDNATLDGYNFIGCLFGAKVGSMNIDINTRLNSSAAGSGCPLNLDSGVTFIGGGHIMRAGITSPGTNSFSLTLSFRTISPSGLLLFVHSRGNDSSYLSLSLINSDVVLTMKDRTTGNVFTVSTSSLSFPQPLCNGQWHTISITKESDGVILEIDTLSVSKAFPSLTLRLTSNLYIGGIPAGSQALQFYNSNYNTFSGCMRSLQYNGVMIDMNAYISQKHVRYFGCEYSSLSISSSCQSESVNLLISQLTTVYNDTTVSPFTEYIYRASASNNAGTIYTEWTSIMTGESVPSDLSEVFVSSKTSSQLTVTWNRPSIPNGLITRYQITATPIQSTGLASPLGNAVTVSLDITEPAQSLIRHIPGLFPATNYSLTLRAYTSAGSSSDTPAGPISYSSTLEDIPIGVQLPQVTSRTSTSLTFTIIPPTQPNGIVTFYRIFINDNTLTSSNNDLSITASDLSPFTNYEYFIQACTAIGCTNSTTSSDMTLSSSPMGLTSPSLSQLSPTTIEATWLPPTSPNGIITHYELVQFIDTNNEVVVFNGSDVQTTVSQLTPNTVYQFKVIAYNMVGSVSSVYTSIRTPEGVPDLIFPPNVTVLNSTSLYITWNQPQQPNGNILNYTLLLDRIPVFTGLVLQYTLTNLQPFTMYSLSIQACTVQGCGNSTQTSVQTNEAPPEGYNAPTISNINSDSFQVFINEVQSPHGIVYYTLQVTGKFLLVAAGNGSQYRSTISETRLVFNGSAETLVIIENLVPFTDYELVLSVINSAGALIGDTFNVTTSSAIPESQLSPSLSLFNATSIRVSWSPPLYPNGLLTNYILTIKLLVTSSDLVLSFSSSITDTIVHGLVPFTNYSVTVTVSNSIGNTVSDPSYITTGEIAPSQFDQVTVLSKTSNSLHITWDPPSSPNGIILNYTVTVGTVSIATVSGDTYDYNITDLAPFTEYNISVLGCNNAGCVTTDPIVTDITGEAVPQGISVPDLFATTSGSVIITWNEPTSPNGVIQSYSLYKALAGDSFSQFATVPSSSMRRYDDSNVLPFTQYDYFIEATNSAGSTSGHPMTIVTSEAAPQDVLAPDLEPLSSTTILIIINPPLTPNGIIIQYTITRTSELNLSPVTITLPAITNYTDTNLTPFTNYTYTITACTSIGCTSGPSASQRTLEAPPTGTTPPTTSLLSDYAILVNWTQPTQPNGIITNYTLIRTNIGFDLNLAAVPNCCENQEQDSLYCTIVTTQTDPFQYSYIDSGLTPYFYYRYCILVFNSAGSMSSDHSSPLRTSIGPHPLVGPNITAIPLNATSLYITWEPLGVELLQGPLVEYSLQYSGGVGEEGIIYNINNENYTLTGLTPSTLYTISVNVSNGRGSTVGPEITVMTRDGIPTGVYPPTVIPLSSNSLIITIIEPQEPNGIISLYEILLNSVVVLNETIPGSYIITELSPYTLYTARLRVCTSYGCNTSELTSNRTLQSAPTGFASPTVTVLDPYTVNVSWNHPTQENGIITVYQIYMRETMSCPLETNPPCYNITLLTSLNRNDPLVYTVSDLIPATMYGFAVTAINQGGNTSSGFTMVTTQEAPPTFVSPPQINPLSSTQLDISWSPPTQPNGNIISYTLYSDDGNIVFGPTLLLTYTQTELTPFTTYTFILQVCTNGGCTNSSAVSDSTLEATPSGFDSLYVSNIDESSLVLSWSPPTSPNGVIRYYEIYFASNDSLIFNTTSMSYGISGLSPFTNYSFYVSACNSVDCVNSDVIYVLTNESLPVGVAITSITALSFDRIEIAWTPPTQSNGIILRYELLRGNVIIFQGLDFQFIDTNLEGGVSYNYIVRAVNSAGATPSLSISVTTPTASPTGISAPLLTVLSSTEIYVQWTEPEKANGVIDYYRVYVNNSVSFQGLVFNYTLTNLAPFTSYAVRIEICTTQGDCGSSSSVINTTLQDRPTGLTPPTLLAMSHDTVVVSWTPPTSPNGIIRFYRIMRRLADNNLVVIFAYNGGPNLFTFTDRNLLAFTRYEYQLVVVNDIGSSTSQWSPVMTLEDAPSNVTAPTFPLVSPYNVTVEWEPPLFSNGIINRYQVFYGLLLGEFTLGADVAGNVTQAVVDGLQPNNPYDFKIRAHNSAGFGDGPAQVVVTSEAPPQNLRLLSIVSKTSESLTLSWLPPLQPNGVIINYALFLNDTEEYRDSATIFTITRLRPYTGYSIQLEACTNAGCTRGPTQGFTTSEASPVSQPAPMFTSIESRSILVTWGSPLQPNGIILSYEVFRMQVPEPLQVNGTDGALLIQSTNDVATRMFNDTQLSPNTGYQYAIRANNSVGFSISSFVYTTTAEDVPEGVPPPNVISLGISQLQVSWEEPGLPNGIITLYHIYRTDPDDITSIQYTGLNRFFVDTSLSPYTLYRYTVQACTLIGCTNGTIGSNRTDQSIPQGFTMLLLMPISNTTISVTWETPLQPNGVLLPYIASVTSPINVSIPTNELSVQFTNLLPFTQYTVSVQACTVIGCISVGPNTVQTLEWIPFLISAPLLAAISPNSINANWSPPLRPNGVITRYILRRNDSIVYDGNSTNFIDTGLLPNRPYTYDIQAFTSIGGGERSSVATVTTQSDTPTNISAPTLSPLTSTSVLASWTPPGEPNGIITQYILYQLDGNTETTVYTGSAMSRVIDNLNIYTQYRYRVEACTTTCGSSLYSTVTTLEDQPTGLAPPSLVPFTNESVLITWEPPTASNGILTSYSLQRRQVLNSGSFGSVQTLASALSPLVQEFLDTDNILEPALTFQYRVGVANSVGSVTSTYASVTLPDAPPEGVATPSLVNKTSLSFAVSMNPPTKPNGLVTSFILHSTSFSPISVQPDTQTDPVIFHIVNLLPFTQYSIYVDTCTSAGCTFSSSITVRTEEDTPTSLSPPIGTVTGSSGIRLDWSPPVHPNGIIISYSLWYKLPCPQPQVYPINSITVTCTESSYQSIGSTSLLTYDFVNTDTAATNSHHPLPYSSYQFLLQAENSAGSVNSTDSSIITTLTDLPQVINAVSFTIFQDNFSISLNWSNTFRLNGALRHFIVIRDGFFLLQGVQTTAIFGNQPTGRALQFSVKAVTDVGEVTSPSYPLFISGPTTNSTISTLTVTPTLSVTDPPPPEDDTPFYQQFPFIVGMVILVILLCFVCFLVLLCFVRPKRSGGAEKYDMSTLKSQGSPTRNDGTVRASWMEPRITPIPSYPDVITGGRSSTRLKSSMYSPSKVALLNHDYNTSGGEEGIPLQDTHITRLSKTDLLPQAPPTHESILGPTPPPFLEDEEYEHRPQPSSTTVHSSIHKRSERGGGRDTPNSTLSNSPSPPPPPLFMATDEESALLDTKI